MSDATSTVRVRLVGLPLEIHRQSGEHQEALRRELALVEHAHTVDAAPARLQALTEELNARYGGLTTAQTEQLNTALAAGDATIDLEYDLPPDVVDAALHLGAMLDELDDFCREGDLLTLVTPPDLLGYRRWFLGEFERQIRDGLPPEPWRNPTSAPAPPEPDAATPSALVRVRVEDDLDLATAPALRNELVSHIDDGVTDITIDLSACEFLDSTGLSLLVTTHHRLLEAGGGLQLEGATGQVQSVLEMAGTTDFFGRA